MLKAELDALKAANAKARQEAVNVREALNWQATKAAELVTSIDAEAALLAKVVPTVPASPPPPPPPPPPAPTGGNILWQDDFQTDANFTKQLWPVCQFGNTQLPGIGSDANGASLSRVRDPLDSTRWAIRFYLNAVGAGQWGRAQLSLHSGTLAALGQQLASKKEVWISQDIIIPAALVPESDKAWLALQDFHVHTNGNVNRLDTWPGFFMGSALLNNCPAGRMISRHSGLVAPYSNVFSQPTTVAVPVNRRFRLTTRYPWPDVQTPAANGNVEYYLDRTKVAEVTITPRPNGQAVLEPMFKLYGEGPWSQKPIVRYLCGVIISDGLPN